MSARLLCGHGLVALARILEGAEARQQRVKVDHQLGQRRSVDMLAQRDSGVRRSGTVQVAGVGRSWCVLFSAALHGRVRLYNGAYKIGHRKYLILSAAPGGRHGR